MNKLAAIIGLLAGTTLLLYWGREVPGWLLKLECLGIMAAALAFGFTHRNVEMPCWTRDDALRGVAMVYLGVGAMFVELNFFVSAFLIGSGIRLVMKSTATVTSRIANPLLAQNKSEIDIRQEGGIRRRP